MIDELKQWEYDKGYERGKKEGAIEELEKIKAKIKDVLDINNERDMLLPASYICKLINKHINELKGEQQCQ